MQRQYKNYPLYYAMDRSSCSSRIGDYVLWVACRFGPVQRVNDRACVGNLFASLLNSSWMSKVDTSDCDCIFCIIVCC